MHLSSETRALFTEFFCETGVCGEEEDFPDVRVYSKTGARIITSIVAADGITFGRRIFVRPVHVNRITPKRHQISKNLLAHELVHVFQYQRRGYFGFVFVYIRDFWREFRAKDKWTSKSWFDAYAAIPDEVEARLFAEDFEFWLRSGN